MINLIHSYVPKIAIAAVIGGICLAQPAFSDDAAPATDAKPATMKHESGKQRVEERIKALHEKLGITADQETKWTAVAKVMRKNEAELHALVEKRHATENASAVDDLKSYQAIAEAHVRGIKKLIPVFEDLYNSMSEDQKKNADDVFGKFEGHDGHQSPKANAPSAAQ